MRSLAFLLLVILSGCSPQAQTPVPVVVQDMLESSQAINDWKLAQDVTDGCSAPWITSWASHLITKDNWDDCCYQHDFDYKVGASWGITKQMADYELWQCVGDSGHPVIANFMYTAVNIFGGKYYKWK